MRVALAPAEFAPPAAPLNTATFLEAANTVWVGAPSNWGGDIPHPAPKRQIFVTTKGRYEVTASDGETRSFPPGSVLLLEDISGKGHSTRIADEDGVVILSIALAEQ